MPAMRDQEAAVRSWWQPVSASSPRSASARPTIGPSSPPANPASARSRASRPRAQDHGSPAPSISCQSSRCRRRRCANGCGEVAAEEAIEQAGIGRKGDFPGPLFLAVPPVEIEWPQRRALANASGANDADHATTTCCARRRSSTASTSASSSLRSPTSSPRPSAPRARRSRCRPPARPARPRSSSASRRSGAARPTPRCASAPTARSAGIADPVFAAVGAVDANDPTARRRQAVLQEPRRLRHGRRRRRAGAGEPGSRQRARRQDPRRDRRLRRDGGFVPPHPLEPGRQADHRLHPQRHRRRRPRARRHRLRQRRTAPARRKTTRWNLSASRRCSASARSRCRSPPTSR